MHLLLSAAAQFSRVGHHCKRQASALHSRVRVHMSHPVDTCDNQFDKDQFNKELHVYAVKIPAKECSKYMKLLANSLLNKPRLRNVKDDPEDSSKRLLLLAEDLNPGDFYSCRVKDNQTLQQIIELNELQVEQTTVQLGYEYLGAHEVLRTLLPKDVEVPVSFETIGHIAHLNLKEELLPWRQLIGSVIMDKNPRVKTVVNKVGTIDNEFRVFKQEVIAGELNTVTEVKQHGLRYRLDFSKVYWNSRLEEEHRRLVETYMKNGQVLVDAMAGIGPFALPAAARGLEVFANDLNPDSYAWLVENIRLNKMQQVVHPYNLDGREFLARAANGLIATAGFDHLVMNLPATAVEFLDALRGSFRPNVWKSRELPLVHVYAFMKADETTEDLQRRIEAALGGTLPTPPDFHAVRDVAPNKMMYCATFRIPDAAAFAPSDKRPKLL